MDYTNLLAKVLPWIGAAATGNVPALVAMAAKEIGSSLGVDIEPTASAIGQAVANATPEQMIALKDREMAFQEKMQAMGFAHIEELAKIGLQEDALSIDDVKDARAHNANNQTVFRLGMFIYGSFAVIMCFVLYGCYKIVSGDVKLEPTVLAAVAGLVGAVVGYVAANTQTVTNFIFGGSLGSSNTSAAMAEAVKSFGQITK